MKNQNKSERIQRVVTVHHPDLTTDINIRNLREITQTGDLLVLKQLTIENFRILTETPPNTVLTYEELLQEEQIEIIGTMEDQDWVIISLPVNQTLPTNNIRPLNMDHAIELGENIITNEQLNPCIADLGPNGKIRVQAGDHRRRGIAHISNWQAPILIKLFLYEMTPEQQLRIKMDENLHIPMTSTEKATVFYNLWQMFIENNPDATQADFAERMQVSPSSLSNAVRFHEGLNPLVQQMVDDKIFFYSQALLLLNLSQNEQVREAAHSILTNATTDIMKKRVQNLLAEQQHIGFFGEDFMSQQLELGTQKLFQLTFDRMTNIAITYLAKISYMTNKAELTSEIPMTKAVERDIVTLITTTYQFLVYLQNNFPETYNSLTTSARDKIDLT
ncbi:hypothetical protein K8R14_03570 [bacterium]|nr:hypothetical protein [bacterium]